MDARPGKNRGTRKNWQDVQALKPGDFVQCRKTGNTGEVEDCEALPGHEPSRDECRVTVGARVRLVRVRFAGGNVEMIQRQYLLAVPRPEEIEETAAKIRAGWQDGEHQYRNSTITPATNRDFAQSQYRLKKADKQRSNKNGQD